MDGWHVDRHSNRSSNGEHRDERRCQGAWFARVPSVGWFGGPAFRVSWLLSLRRPPAAVGAAASPRSSEPTTE